MASEDRSNSPDFDTERERARHAASDAGASVREMAAACNAFAIEHDDASHWRFTRGFARVACEVAAHHDAGRIPTKVAEDLLSTVMIELVHAVHESPDEKGEPIAPAEWRADVERRMAEIWDALCPEEPSENA